MSKIIGIMGGMGPLATVNLLEKIIRLTPAQKDQDHLHMLVDIYPQIEDRTDAILYEGVSPLKKLIESAKNLQAQEAKVLGIACNTAYYYLEELQKQVEIPIVDMPLEACKEAKKLGWKKALLLSTKGTRQMGIFQKRAQSVGLELLEVSEEEQEILTYCIYEVVKKGDFQQDLSPLKKLLEKYKDLCEGALIGCTELPILFEKYSVDYPVVDATLSLGKALVKIGLEMRKYENQGD